MKYPFDPSIKNHLWLALGLALWVFAFLYFTEPLDVNELNNKQQLIYLPIYGIAVALAYIGMLPLQKWLHRKDQRNWTIKNEIVFFLIFISSALILARSVYLYIVVPGEPNPYKLVFFIKSIFIPAALTIFPIVALGRWALGKYKNKQLEKQKIEIQGEGNYESLRVLLDDLICVQSSDNYVEVSFLDNGVLKKQLIRTKLSAVEDDHIDLLRTHRSYLINPYHFLSFKTVEGKQGIQLTSDIFAPISKTYATAVKEALNFTTN